MAATCTDGQESRAPVAADTVSWCSTSSALSASAWTSSTTWWEFAIVPLHTLHDDPCCTALCAIGSVLIVLLLSCTLCAPCGTTGPLQDGFTPWLHACFAGKLDLIKWLAVDMRVDTSAASAVRGMHSAFVCQSFQLTMLRVAWWSAGWRHWV